MPETNTPKVTSTRIVKVDGEWIVRAYVNGKRYPAADYFTDDKKDAEQTAAMMIR